jgi:hypothetical protein
VARGRRRCHRRRRRHPGAARGPLAGPLARRPGAGSGRGRGGDRFGGSHGDAGQRGAARVRPPALGPRHDERLPRRPDRPDQVGGGAPRRGRTAGDDGALEAGAGGPQRQSIGQRDLGLGGPDLGHERAAPRGDRERDRRRPRGGAGGGPEPRR